VAVFRGYFDASRRTNVADRGGVLAIGGYLASVDVWDRYFDPRWRAALCKSPAPIKEFKASDCRCGWGDFENWTKQERDDLEARVVGILEACGEHGVMMGLGTAIEVPYSSDTEMRRRLEGYGYIMCVGQIIHNTLNWAAKLSPGDGVQFIFDREPKLQGHALTMFDKMRDAFDLNVLAGVGSPQFEHSHVLAPLQAADLLAYETYRECFGRFLPDPEPISPILGRLVRTRHYFADYISRELIQQQVRGERLSLTQHPDGTYRFPVLYDKGGVQRDQSR